MGARDTTAWNGQHGGAVVTGAGRGLGREIARLLASRGYVVHVTDVDDAAAAQTAAEIGGASFSSALDVRDEAGCATVVATTVARAGGLDVWVNNAGVLHTGPAWEQDPRTRRLMVEVNALGTMNGTLAALDAMRSTGHGHVVNIVSLAGLVAAPGETVYSASKHAALAFSLATLSDLRMADFRRVHISCVCPHGIWTPMLQDKVGDRNAALSFSAKLLQPQDVVDVVGRVLDRPRPVTVVPRWQGVQVRLLDALPSLAVRVSPFVHRVARIRQRRYAKRVAVPRRTPP